MIKYINPFGGIQEGESATASPNLCKGEGSNPTASPVKPTPASVRIGIMRLTEIELGFLLASYSADFSRPSALLP